MVFYICIKIQKKMDFGEFFDPMPDNGNLLI